MVIIFSIFRARPGSAGKLVSARALECGAALDVDVDVDIAARARSAR
jgi:hypothetical protein